MDIGSDIGKVQRDNTIVQSAEQVGTNNWNSSKLKYYDEQIEHGITPKVRSPYYDNQPGLRRQNIQWEFSEEEEIEFEI